MCEYKNYEQEVIDLRRHFHSHPELGFKEFKTSAFIKKYLEDLGLKPFSMAGTGVVAILEGKYPGKTLLLRADMDALPIQEENDVPYVSQNPGVSHACGHDGHMAMLLVAARILTENRERMHGRVKLVFQPNEEVVGARYMVEEGVLKNPDVDASFGVHLWTPLKSGTIGLKSGAVMAEMYNFSIELTGKSCHSSSPEDGADAIMCAVSLVQALQLIPTREINPASTTVLSVCSIHGGDSTNIIADHVTLKGSMRYLYDGSDSGKEQPMVRIRRIAEGIGQAHRVKCDVEFEVSNYILINDEKCVEFLKEEVMPEIAENKCIVPYCTMAGDDFSELSFKNNVPGAYVFIGTGNSEKRSDRPHHAADFNIDEDTLITGVKFHVKTALAFLKE